MHVYHLWVADMVSCRASILDLRGCDQVIAACIDNLYDGCMYCSAGHLSSLFIECYVTKKNNTRIVHKINLIIIIITLFVNVQNPIVRTNV